MRCSHAERIAVPAPDGVAQGRPLRLGSAPVRIHVDDSFNVVLITMNQDTIACIDNLHRRWIEHRRRHPLLAVEFGILGHGIVGGG